MLPFTDLDTQIVSACSQPTISAVESMDAETMDERRAICIDWTTPFYISDLCIHRIGILGAPGASLLQIMRDDYIARSYLLLPKFSYLYNSGY